MVARAADCAGIKGRSHGRRRTRRCGGGGWVQVYKRYRFRVSTLGLMNSGWDVIGSLRSGSAIMSGRRPTSHMPPKSTEMASAESGRSPNLVPGLPLLSDAAFWKHLERHSACRLNIWKRIRLTATRTPEPFVRSPYGPPHVSPWRKQGA